MPSIGEAISNNYSGVHNVINLIKISDDLFDKKPRATTTSLLTSNDFEFLQKIMKNLQSDAQHIICNNEACG